MLMAGGDEVVASEYAGRRGVPAYFPAAVFAELMSCGGMWGLGSCCRGLEVWSCRVGSWMWIRWRSWTDGIVWQSDLGLQQRRGSVT